MTDQTITALVAGGFLLTALAAFVEWIREKRRR
jgi:hypothetical protein